MENINNFGIPFIHYVIKQFDQPVVKGFAVQSFNNVGRLGYNKLPYLKPLIQLFFYFGAFGYWISGDNRLGRNDRNLIASCTQLCSNFQCKGFRSGITSRKKLMAGKQNTQRYTPPTYF